MTEQTERLIIQLCALGAVDAALVLAALFGRSELSSRSCVMINLAVVVFLRRPAPGSFISDMKSLPAIAAAGAIIVQVTGSEIRLIELLSTSAVRRVRDPFKEALSSCYRGVSADDALGKSSSSLPFQGLAAGLKGLQAGRNIETVASQTARSGTDLTSHYQRALGTMETRISVVQGAAFFLPMISLIAFSRFSSGPFDALAVCALSFSSLRYLARLAEV